MRAQDVFAAKAAAAEFFWLKEPFAIFHCQTVRFRGLASFADYLSSIHRSFACAGTSQIRALAYSEERKTDSWPDFKIDCAVRNLTNTGARIQVANTVNLPQDFEMNFRRLPLDQTMPACLANSD